MQAMPSRESAPNATLRGAGCKQACADATRVSGASAVHAGAAATARAGQTAALQPDAIKARLKQQVQFERFGDNNRLKIPGMGEFTGIKSMILLEVEGMPELKWQFGYPMALGLIASAAGLLWWRFKRAGWL